MRKIVVIVIIGFSLFSPFRVVGQDHGNWWDSSYTGLLQSDFDKKRLPLIEVDGNRFTVNDGQTMLFHGLSIADPDKVEKDGRWNRRYFEEVKKWGANLVRIPVHPVAWRNRGHEGYLVLLDQAVKWCTELDMYIIIDWHSIGNLQMELFQDPMYHTSKTETYNFWRTIARRYIGINTVAFYEFFNEPTIFRGQLGRMSWSQWKQINENLIHLIRAFDMETIPLVAGFDWAYDLTPLRIDPVDAVGIAYVTHPYPHKRTPPYEPKWEEDFGFATGTYPVIATELGFTLDDGSMEKNREYGERIIRYFQAKGMSWVAWVFDPEWHPQMFTSWDTFQYTDNGAFFSNAAKGLIK